MGLFRPPTIWAWRSQEYFIAVQQNLETLNHFKSPTIWVNVYQTHRGNPTTTWFPERELKPSIACVVYRLYNGAREWWSSPQLNFQGRFSDRLLASFISIVGLSDQTQCWQIACVYHQYNGARAPPKHLVFADNVIVQVWCLRTMSTPFRSSATVARFYSVVLRATSLSRIHHFNEKLFLCSTNFINFDQTMPSFLQIAGTNLGFVSIHHPENADNLAVIQGWLKHAKAVYLLRAYIFIFYLASTHLAQRRPRFDDLSTCLKCFSQGLNESIW